MSLPEGEPGVHLNSKKTGLTGGVYRHPPERPSIRPRHRIHSYSVLVDGSASLKSFVNPVDEMIWRSLA